MADAPVVPTLTDGVVTLRPFSHDDLDSIVEHCNDPEVVAYTTVPTPYTRADGLDWIDNFVPTSWVAGTDLTFAIEAEHPDGVRRFSGGITLRPQPEGIAEIGFAVHFAVRGKGFGRRAIALITDWGFANRGVEVVLWRAYVGNWGSRRVVWSSGFTIDGTSEKLLEHRGERRDAWVGTFRKGDTRDPKKPWLIPPVLETPRLRLRPFIDADGPRLVEVYQDDRSRHFGGRVPGVRQSDPQVAITRYREQCANGHQYNWCIADRSTDQLLGHVQLFDLNGLDDTEAKPGCAIHPDARGRGVLTEALGGLVEWTFRPASAGGLGRRRITISTAASNKASRHAAEVAGFTHAATLPTAFTLGETDFDDEVLYQVTNPSWQG